MYVRVIIRRKKNIYLIGDNIMSIMRYFYWYLIGMINFRLMVVL